jgi:hypothetical protein
MLRRLQHLDHQQIEPLPASLIEQMRLMAAVVICSQIPLFLRSP